MIFPPTEADVLPFLARCVRHGRVTDVRKLHGAQCDAEIEQERRDYLAAAKRRSRARLNAAARGEK
jgi:hypothetical protein